jgi:drug/metabolite transporter (DMT)-like permease
MPSPAINRSMNAHEWALLLGLSILWGGSFLAIGIAIKELPPLTLVTARLALAAIALQGMMFFLKLKMPWDKAAWQAFTSMAFIANVIPFVLIAWGQTYIASGLASILNAATPLFTVIVAHVLTRDEKMRGNRLIGVLIGFAGVGVMIGGAALRDLGVHITAQLAVVLATLCYALSTVFGRRFQTMHISPIATATGQVTAASLMLLPVALIVDQPWALPAPSTATIGAMLSLALISTALAYIIFFRILATAGATNISLVTFLVPVTAIILGALVLDERLALKHFIGMGLIGCGLAAIDGRLLHLIRKNWNGSKTDL